MLQPWVDSARAKGLREIAFTDHDRYHAGIDFGVLDELRARNADIAIRAGIELDNDPATGPAGRAWVEQHWDRLDFVLGSVHYLTNPEQMFDTVPAGAGQFEGRDVDEIYADYFERVRAMAESGLVDCLAHLDLVKIHGHRPHAANREYFESTLDCIAERKLSLELSTAGWRKPVHEHYPADDIIARALAKGISFTTASDAHSWAQLGENYDRLAERITAVGIHRICVYKKHRSIATIL